MKVAITKVEDFSGKDGREWTRISYVAEGGTTGSKVIPRGKLVLDDIKPVTLSPAAFSYTLVFGEQGGLTDIE